MGTIKAEIYKITRASERANGCHKEITRGTESGRVTFGHKPNAPYQGQATERSFNRILGTRHWETRKTSN